MIESMAVESIVADSVFNPRDAEAHQQVDWKRDKERRLNSVLEIKCPRREFLATTGYFYARNHP